MIPHTIHQVWLGPRPRPTAWMSTWATVNPDWDYRLWTEDDIDDGMLTRPLILRCLEMGVYDAAADALRVEALLRAGGVYADADSEALRPLNEADFIRVGFFATREKSPHKQLFITNAFMGSVADHPVLLRYQALLARVRFPDACRHGGVGAAFCCAWQLTGPRLLTRVIRQTPSVGIRVLEPSAFFDRTIQGEVLNGEPFGRHHWSLTGERTQDKTWFAGSSEYAEGRTA